MNFSFSSRPILAMLSVLSCLFLSACTIHVTPNQYPLHQETASDLQIENQRIQVINNQSHNQKRILASEGLDKYVGDLRQWTDVAVGLLKSELQKRGATTTGQNATKTLKLRVTSAQIFFGAWATRCIVHLQLNTDQGMSKDFTGNNASPVDVQRSCDGAVTRAVEAVLKDKDVQEYLQN